MSNFQTLAINFTYLLYNLKPVDVELKTELPLMDNYYGEGDELKLPMWYARLIRSRKVCSIKEFDAVDKIFNKALGDQSLNKTSLVKIPRDFYFIAVDYINSIKNGKHSERKEKLIEFKNLRRKIIMRMLELGQDQTHKLTKMMTFEEVLFYLSMLGIKKGAYDKLDNLILEDEEE